MRKKICLGICLLLSFCLLLCACSGNGTQSGGEDSGTDSAASPQNTAGTIILPYSASDSLNPFFAAGVENLALADLSYEPLYRVKADYTPQAVLSDSADLTANAVTVTLKSAVFSDGSKVSAADVVYSFNRAKGASAYAQVLSNIEAVKAGDGTVIFTLASPDIYALNTLTFPIVKNKTAETAESIPVGSGPYLYSGGEFIKNTGSAQAVQTEKIQLYNITDFTYISNALEIGNVNFLFDDLSGGTYQRLAVENTKLPMNNLVFLGLNGAYGALSSAAVRTAVYYAVDKAEIASSAYQGYAEAAATAFHPAFAELSGGSYPGTAANRGKTESILDKTGYNRYTRSGCRTNGTAELKFTLLVNAENGFRLSAAQSIADSLNALGFSVTVESVPQEQYLSRIASGNFQMYLGEIKLTENMDISPLLRTGGSASAGIDKTLRVCTDYNALREGTIGLEAFMTSFMNDMPFVPVCYRSGLAAYKTGITPDFAYASASLYGAIANWRVS